MNAKAFVKKIRKTRMFFDKTILSVSHTNLLQTFIILSLASIGPSKERPYVLLYPFETRWE